MKPDTINEGINSEMEIDIRRSAYDTVLNIRLNFPLTLQGAMIVRRKCFLTPAYLSNPEFFKKESIRLLDTY